MSIIACLCIVGVYVLGAWAYVACMLRKRYVLALVTVLVSARLVVFIIDWLLTPSMLQWRL